MSFQNSADTNKPLEFSLNEQQNTDFLNSLSSINHFPAQPKTPSPTRVISDPDFGKKYLIAFLYLESTLLRAKLRKAEQQVSLERMKDSAKICVSNLRYQEMSKNLIFKSQKCLDLEIELSKLKNKFEKMKNFGRNRAEEDKENDMLNSNRGGTPSKTKRMRRKNSYKKESKQLRRRSRSKNRSRNKTSTDKKRGVNTEFGLRFNSKKFKENYKNAEKKALTFLQIFDNSRQEIITNIEGLEKIRRVNPDSIKNNKVLRAQKLLLQSICLNKWRLTSGFPTLNKRSLLTEESLLPLLKNPISEKMWNLACLKEKPSSEFQLFRLNKGYIMYERSMLDFKKEIFFKRRFRVLMNSILRESQRRFKIIKIIAFYKLIASSVFIDREDLGIIGREKYQGIQKSITSIGNQIKEKVISSGGLDRNDSFLVGKSFFLFNKENEDENFPMNLLESEEKANAKRKWIENIKDPKIIPNDVELLELQMKSHGGLKLKNSIYLDGKVKKGRGRIGKSVLKTKHKMLIEEKKKRLITKMLYRLYLRLIQRRRNAIQTWFKQSMKSQQAELLEEFENMNIVLSERAFREKVFRTKIRLLQNQIEKQIEYFGMMMKEDVTGDYSVMTALKKSGEFI